MYSAIETTRRHDGGTIEGSWIEARLLQALEEAQTMDQLAARFPTMSWSQIFLTVDRLSRAGFVSIQRSGNRDYLIALRRAA